MAGSARGNGRRKEDKERHTDKLSAEVIGKHLALNVSPSRRIQFVSGREDGEYSRAEEVTHVFGNGDSHEKTHEIGAHGIYPPGFVLLNGKGDSDDDDDVPHSNGINLRQQRSSRHVKSGEHISSDRSSDEEQDEDTRIDTEERENGEYPVAIDLDWKDVRKVGAGLHNLGNTCFMNSVLQCLTHTPPLAMLALSIDSNGRGSFNDILNHIKQALLSSGGIVSPTQLVRTLRHTSKQFRHGRQEDAHEYARCLLEACQKEKTSGRINREVNGKEQISHIFEGRLCSQVKCLSAKCHYVSNTFEPFLDLSLEITRASTLAKALHRFTAVETLDGANKYECEKCRSRVRASKRFWIETPPNILTIHLKRFEFGAFGRKIDKHVKFPATLDMTPHLRIPGRCKHLYSLYAVLVHAGHSTHSGHYYSFVRAPSGMWHIMDDGRVRQVAENHVLAQNAYMLFYVRKVERNKESKPLAKRRKTTEAQVHQNGNSHSHYRNDESTLKNTVQHTSSNGGEGNNRKLKSVVLSNGDNKKLSNGELDPYQHEENPSVMNDKSKSECKSMSKGKNVVQKENGISFGNRSMLTLLGKKIRPFLKARHSIQKKRSILLKFRNLFRSRSESDLLDTDIKSDDANGVSHRKNKKMKSESEDVAGNENEYKRRVQSINTRDERRGVDGIHGGDGKEDMNTSNVATDNDNYTFSDLNLSNGHTANLLNVEQWDGLENSVREKAKKLNRKSMPKVREVDEWDKEYDRGKQRKVKTPRRSDEQEETDIMLHVAENPFQNLATGNGNISYDARYSRTKRRDGNGKPNRGDRWRFGNGNHNGNGGVNKRRFSGKPPGAFRRKEYGKASKRS